MSCCVENRWPDQRKLTKGIAKQASIKPSNSALANRQLCSLGRGSRVEFLAAFLIKDELWSSSATNVLVKCGRWHLRAPSYNDSPVVLKRGISCQPRSKETEQRRNLKGHHLQHNALLALWAESPSPTPLLLSVTCAPLGVLFLFLDVNSFRRRLPVTALLIPTALSTGLKTLMKVLLKCGQRHRLSFI